MQDADKFKEIFDKSPIGILFYDKNGKLTNANESALEIAGILQLEDVKGTNLFDNPYVESHKEELLENGLIRFQSPLNFDNIKELGFYTPTKSGTAFIDYTISTTDSGFLAQLQDVTDKKEIEEKFYKAFNNNPAAMAITDTNNITIDANKSYLELTEYSREELIGKNPLELNIVSSEESRPYVEELEKNGTLPELEIGITTKSGKKRTVMGNVEFIEIEGKRATLSSIYDITERKKAEEQVKSERNHLETILETNPAAIIIVELNGRISYINRRAKQLYGIDITDLNLDAAVSKVKAKRIDGSEYLPGESPTGRALKGKEVHNEEVIMEQADGTAIPISASTAPLINSKGEIIAAVAIFEDITERKKSEVKIQELLEETQQFAEELEVSNNELRSAAEELQRINEDLRVSNEKFATAFANNPAAVVMTRLEDGIYLEVNDTFTKILGYNREDIIGKSARKLPVWPTAEASQQFVEELNEKGFIRDWEREFRKKSGELFTAQLSAQVLTINGVKVILSTLIDITERKKAEEELRKAGEYLEEQVEKRTKELKKAYKSIKKSEYQFKTLAENSPDIVTRYDTDLKIIYINQGSPLINISKEYFIGKTPSELGTDKENVKLWTENLTKALKTGKNQKIEYQFPGIKGMKTFSSIITPEFNDEGNIVSLLVISRDITERKKAEWQLKETVTELERSNEELQSFAYITSHDLQEPLRTMASYAQLLKRRYKGQLGEDADEFIEYIVSGSKRMKQQIQGLLEYSRVGTLDGNFYKFKAENALKHTLLNLSSSIDDYNAKVTYDPLPTIMGDETQIIRVFQNLIGNALKFRRAGVQPQIHISARKEDSEYIFIVADNGIGIEEQYTDRIFEVFKRLHAIGEYEGAGIGLAIVKRIINSHRGRVWVESEYGRGSTFYFTIPINEEEEEEEEVTSN
ncbi:PAS domain S-box protein [Methanobacterium sp. ACI-7]|uniref:PAS domain S-box protein n=1 Tax=unclassified Methanobacterium TaxID=2627676 RepID=UPI0039C2A522